MAAFHHMIHRMESLLLSKEEKRKEREQIFKICGVNGYPERSISGYHWQKINSFLQSISNYFNTDNREFEESVGGMQ